MGDDMSEKISTRWLARLDDSDHVLWWLFAASFLETLVVPIPIELVLIPYMVANRDRLKRTATMVTLGCLVASLLGYGIGFFLFETAGEWIIRAAGWQSAYQSYQGFVDAHGFLAIVAVGIIPIPFQVAMLAAGAASYPVWKFVLAATIARGIRYYGLAGLVALVGERAERLWKRHRWAAVLLLVLVLAGFWGLTQWLGSIVRDSEGGQGGPEQAAELVLPRSELPGASPGPAQSCS